MQRNNQKLTASVVITNFNGKELLEKNLPAVINAKNNKDNSIIEIIVVDDFSTDESLKYLSILKSDISIIKHTKNRGFSATTNTGVRATKGDLVDEMLAKYINIANCPVPIKRLGGGFYLFGLKKIYAKIMNGKLVIRVGGGYMIIEEFISSYAQAELNKLEQLARREGVSDFMELDLEYYALGDKNRNGVGGQKSPGGQNSPGNGRASTAGDSGTVRRLVPGASR